MLNGMLSPLPWHALTLGAFCKAELLDALGVGAVVNCAASQVVVAEPLPQGAGRAVYRLSINDAPIVGPNGAVGFDTVAFEGANAFIAQHLSQGTSVLVHCAGGISRSAAVTIAFLVSTGYSLRNAFRQVEAARPRIAPNAGLVQQLRHFEMATHGGASTMNAPLSVHQRGGYTFVDDLSR
eukprot:Tamp_26548.p1 GENE.Tamp_26548~~Tamp_26548.p1  ORF type:complete len:181 (+),score=28.43 Tamp_26548:256-798(+)